MLPKRKSRPIVVAGHRFRYSISCSWRDSGVFDFNITIQSESKNGSKLLAKGLVTRNFWLDFPNPEIEPGTYPIITPRHIEAMVMKALNEGWSYEAGESDHPLVLDNETTFDQPTKTKS